MPETKADEGVGCAHAVTARKPFLNRARQQAVLRIERTTTLATWYERAILPMRAIPCEMMNPGVWREAMKRTQPWIHSVYGAIGFTLILCALAMPAAAQWLKFPTAGIPRTPDGKPDLNAPAPRSPDGKPDLSGLWQPPDGYVQNIIRDLKPGEVSLKPWAAELYQHRRDTESKEDPTGWCVPGGVPRSDVVPYPFKIFTLPGVTLILYEAVQSYRQIFTDGRSFPKDPNPAWMGYSIGHWEDDTLIVETAGFNDHGWVDNYGLPNTDALRVTERFRRRDFGHMDLEVTVDDPKAYAKPWTVKLAFRLLADTELLEYICSENNKDLEHLVGK
jgi:hypothetical protein